MKKLKLTGPAAQWGVIWFHDRNLVIVDGAVEIEDEEEALAQELARQGRFPIEKERNSGTDKPAGDVRGGADGAPKAGVPVAPQGTEDRGKTPSP